jgi:hypothetical protein
MISELFFYPLVLVALMWLCFMLHWVWPRDTTVCPTIPELPPPPRKRAQGPKSFAVLTQKPHCDACQHTTDSHPQAPAAPPPRIVPTRGRRRQVDTATHFCPHPHCQYQGWTGWQRATTLCKGQDSLRQQPSASRMPPYARLSHSPKCTNGPGSAKQWRPQTPAMAAGGWCVETVKLNGLGVSVIMPRGLNEVW